MLQWPGMLYPPQHLRQPISDHRSFIALFGIHGNDIRRQVICFRGLPQPHHLFPPQIFIIFALIEMVLVNGWWSSGGRRFCIDNVVWVKSTCKIIITGFWVSFPPITSWLNKARSEEQRSSPKDSSCTGRWPVEHQNPTSNIKSYCGTWKETSIHQNPSSYRIFVWHLIESSSY